MKKQYANTEELLTDEHFLAWYFDPAGREKGQGQEWKEWMDADPSRIALLEDAARLMHGLRIAERPVSCRQTEQALQRLSQRMSTQEQQRPATEGKHRRRTEGKQSLFLLRNYLHVAARNLVKDKGFAGINIFGLALGLAVCLLITLYVADEFSYDKFNKKADRIYRLGSDISIRGNGANDFFTPAPMGPALAKDYPMVETYTRITGMHDILVRYGSNTISEHGCILADSTIFDVFTLPFIVGNPRTALSHAYDMVISEKMARKYFQSVSHDVLGRTLHINNEKDYRITGIIKDMPDQSHFQANFIQSLAELDFTRTAEAWLSNGLITYVVVKPGTSAATLDHCLDQITGKYIIPRIKDILHGDQGDLLDKHNRFRYYAFPLTRIHLWSHLPSEQGNGNSLYVFIFIISIAGMLSREFMLLTGIATLIACPISWWTMNKWLEDFAYRTTIAWWIFAVAGGIAMAITVLTISFRTLRAARANPIKSLRTD